MWIIDYITGTYHLINVCRIGFYIFKQWLVELVNQNTYWNFILAATIQVDECFCCLHRSQEKNFVAHVLFDYFEIFSQILLFLRDFFDVVNNHNIFFVYHECVQHKMCPCNFSFVINGWHQSMIFPKLLLTYKSLICTLRWHNVLYLNWFNLGIRSNIIKLLVKVK